MNDEYPWGGLTEERYFREDMEKVMRQIEALRAELRIDSFADAKDLPFGYTPEHAYMEKALNQDHLDEIVSFVDMCMHHPAVAAYTQGVECASFVKKDDEQPPDIGNDFIEACLS